MANLMDAVEETETVATGSPPPYGQLIETVMGGMRLVVLLLCSIQVSGLRGLLRERTAEQKTSIIGRFVHLKVFLHFIVVLNSLKFSLNVKDRFKQKACMQ